MLTLIVILTFRDHHFIDCLNSLVISKVIRFIQKANQLPTDTEESKANPQLQTLIKQPYTDKTLVHN